MFCRGKGDVKTCFCRCKWSGSTNSQVFNPPRLSAGPFGHSFDCIQVACTRFAIYKLLALRSFNRNFGKLKLPSSQATLVRVAPSQARDGVKKSFCNGKHSRSNLLKTALYERELLLAANEEKERGMFERWESSVEWETRAASCSVPDFVA